VLRLLARNALPHMHGTRRPDRRQSGPAILQCTTARSGLTRGLWSPLEKSASLRRGSGSPHICSHGLGHTLPTAMVGVVDRKGSAAATQGPPPSDRRRLSSEVLFERYARQYVHVVILAALSILHENSVAALRLRISAKVNRTGRQTTVVPDPGQAISDCCAIGLREVSSAQASRP